VEIFDGGKKWLLKMAFEVRRVVIANDLSGKALAASRRI
jgi:hypothetical protein